MIVVKTRCWCSTDSGDIGGSLRLPGGFDIVCLCKDFGLLHNVVLRGGIDAGLGAGNLVLEIAAAELRVEGGVGELALLFAHGAATSGVVGGGVGSVAGAEGQRGEQFRVDDADERPDGEDGGAKDADVDFDNGPDANLDLDPGLVEITDSAHARDGADEGGDNDKGRGGDNGEQDAFLPWCHLESHCMSWLAEWNDEAMDTLTNFGNDKDNQGSVTSNIEASCQRDNEGAADGAVGIAQHPGIGDGRASKGRQTEQDEQSADDPDHDDSNKTLAQLVRKDAQVETRDGELSEGQGKHVNQLDSVGKLQHTDPILHARRLDMLPNPDGNHGEVDGKDGHGREPRAEEQSIIPTPSSQNQCARVDTRKEDARCENKGNRGAGDIARNSRFSQEGGRHRCGIILQARQRLAVVASHGENMTTYSHDDD